MPVENKGHLSKLTILFLLILTILKKHLSILKHDEEATNTLHGRLTPLHRMKIRIGEGHQFPLGVGYSFSPPLLQRHFIICINRANSHIWQKQRFSARSNQNPGILLLQNVENIYVIRKKRCKLRKFH